MKVEFGKHLFQDTPEPVSQLSFPLGPDLSFWAVHTLEGPKGQPVVSSPGSPPRKKNASQGASVPGRDREVAGGSWEAWEVVVTGPVGRGPGHQKPVLPATIPIPMAAAMPPPAPRLSSACAWQGRRGQRGGLGHAGSGLGLGKLKQNLLRPVAHLGVLGVCDFGRRVSSTPKASVSPPVKGRSKLLILSGRDQDS